MKTFVQPVIISLYAASALLAQDGGGWRRVGEEAAPRPEQSAAPAQAGVAAPGNLTIPAGTYIRVRVNEPISTNQNRAGDAFTVTLSEPVVAQGFVVARRGQTFGGHVAASEKGGRIKGTSRLGLELTELVLVDGQPVPMRSELIQFSGGTTVTRDGTAIAATSGIGAIAGAAAQGAGAAGIGAAAGAAAATIGVLVTRGRPAVVYPEDVLTFRTVAPIPISTEAAPQAFAAVRQADYESSPQLQSRRSYAPPPARGVFFGGPMWGYGGPWGWGYPYSYVGTRVVIGRGFGGRRFRR